MHNTACGPECFACAVTAGDKQLLGSAKLGVSYLPVVRNEAVGVRIGFLKQYELGALELQLECPGVLCVDLGYDGVLWLLVPPCVVAGLGAKTLLLGAFAGFEDGE